MHSINKILVPVDFSPVAKEALHSAFNIAWRWQASVHVVYVRVPYADIGEKERDKRLRAFIEETKAAHTRLNPNQDLNTTFKVEWEAMADPADTNLIVMARSIEAQHLMQDFDPRVEHIIEQDVAIAPAIIRYATHEDIDLIVIGTHGRRGIRRFLLGSVARELVQRAPCPVLTVQTSALSPGLHTIVVPLDFSEASYSALVAARSLAATWKARLHLVHIIQDMFHPAFYGPSVQSVYDLEPKIEAKCLNLMERAYAETEGPVVPVTYEIRSGNPAQRITQYAREQRADLIVMATQGRTGLEHFVLGSVAEKIIRTAPSPVWVIKPVPAETPKTNTRPKVMVTHPDTTL